MNVLLIVMLEDVPFIRLYGMEGIGPQTRKQIKVMALTQGWYLCNSCNMGMRDLPDMYA